MIFPSTEEDLDFIMQVPPEWVENEQWENENPALKNILIKCLKMQKKNLAKELFRFIPNHIINRWINELALRRGYLEGGPDAGENKVESIND